jgi:hypothetical protein
MDCIAFGRIGSGPFVLYMADRSTHLFGWVLHFIPQQTAGAGTTATVVVVVAAAAAAGAIAAESGAAIEHRKAASQPALHCYGSWLDLGKRASLCSGGGGGIQLSLLSTPPRRKTVKPSKSTH